MNTEVLNWLFERLDVKISVRIVGSFYDEKGNLFQVHPNDPRVEEISEITCLLYKGTLIDEDSN